MQVLALESYHLRIGIKQCKLCAATGDVAFLAARRVQDLKLDNDELLIAMTVIPLLLKDAAVIFKAKHYGPDAIAFINYREVTSYDAIISSFRSLVRHVTGSR